MKKIVASALLLGSFLAAYPLHSNSCDPSESKVTIEGNIFIIKDPLICAGEIHPSLIEHCSYHKSSSREKSIEHMEMNLVKVEIFKAKQNWYKEAFGIDIKGRTLMVRVCVKSKGFCDWDRHGRPSEFEVKVIRQNDSKGRSYYGENLFFPKYLPVSLFEDKKEGEAVELTYTNSKGTETIVKLTLAQKKVDDSKDVFENVLTNLVNLYNAPAD